jgi:sigma-B regulation protein RsbU (phosphoserine phosphatase)
MSEREDNAAARDLQRVLDISRAMVATVELDNLLPLIIDRSTELLAAERATLFLYDRDRDQLFSRFATGADEIRIPAGKGIAGACIRTRSVINVPDAYADDRFNPDVDRQTGFRTRNILAVPLLDYSGDLVGVLEVINKRAGAFSEYDISLAETLAAQAGVSIQRANLINHFIAKQKMQRAMEIAKEIQKGLLPRFNPQVPSFDIAGFSQPADETGGDVYDFLPLSDGRLGVIVADAAGHGIGPALVIAETRAMLRALIRQTSEIQPVLRAVNDLLSHDLDDARFVTCFFGLLDAAESSLSYASAGQGPILLYDSRTERFEQKMATTVPLGVFDDLSFDEIVTHKLLPGDFVAVLTDGLFEAMDDKGEQFGIERVMDLLRCCHDMPSAQVVEMLRDTVMAYTGLGEQTDDLTAVMIRRL